MLSSLFLQVRDVAIDPVPDRYRGDRRRSPDGAAHPAVARQVERQHRGAPPPRGQRSVSILPRSTSEVKYQCHIPRSNKGCVSVASQGQLSPSPNIRSIDHQGQSQTSRSTTSGLLFKVKHRVTFHGEEGSTSGSNINVIKTEIKYRGQPLKRM